MLPNQYIDKLEREVISLRSENGGLQHEIANMKQRHNREIESAGTYLDVVRELLHQCKNEGNGECSIPTWFIMDVRKKWNSWA